MCSGEGSVRKEDAGLVGRAEHGAVAELRATVPASLDRLSGVSTLSVLASLLYAQTR